VQASAYELFYFIFIIFYLFISSFSTPDTQAEATDDKPWLPEQREERIPNQQELVEFYATSDRVAIIVAPKPNRRLVPTVLNAIANLPFEWKVQVFHRLGSSPFSYVIHNEA
jgi:hypothetical protein